MSEKKYTLVQEDRIEFGFSFKTLCRIKALRNFSDVKEGDLGGGIEKETNLSHEGDCWIYGDAVVHENAQVRGNAVIHDKAQIYGNAKVYGSAVVRDKAKVYGHAVIHDKAQIYGNTRVHENAQVCGDAEVYENAEIRDVTVICGNKVVRGNTKYGGGNSFWWIVIGSIVLSLILMAS